MGDPTIDPISAVLVQLDQLKAARSAEQVAAVALMSAQACLVTARVVAAQADQDVTTTAKAANELIVSIEAALEAMKTPAV